MVPETAFFRLLHAESDSENTSKMSWQTRSLGVGRRIAASNCRAGAPPANRKPRREDSAPAGVSAPAIWLDTRAHRFRKSLESNRERLSSQSMLRKTIADCWARFRAE